MSKFDYLPMDNGYDSVVVFNKDIYTEEQALDIALDELDMEFYDELEVFESYVQYGYFKRPDDVEVFNCWFIKDIYKPVKKTSKNQVPVWVVSPLIID